jgi:hypothetical protein
MIFLVAVLLLLLLLCGTFFLVIGLHFAAEVSFAAASRMKRAKRERHLRSPMMKSDRERNDFLITALPYDEIQSYVSSGSKQWFAAWLVFLPTTADCFLSARVVVLYFFPSSW